MCRCLKTGHVPSTECARAMLQNRAISENCHLMLLLRLCLKVEVQADYMQTFLRL